MAARKVKKSLAPKPASQLSAPNLRNITTRIREANSFIILLSIAVILLIVLFFLNKSWLIAATVNGSPITSIELQSRLNEEYRKQALEQIINEKIILLEAKSKGISVTDSEVNAKIAELETRFGGAENLDNLLEQQGSNRTSLNKQIRAQIALEKMYENEATVSAEEVDSYIKENKAVLAATSEAEQRVEAEKNLKEEKLLRIFSEKFQELKDKAKVIIF